MAKVSYKLIPPEFDAYYSKVLTPNDRYTFSSVRRTVSFFSRARIKGITEKSVLPEASLAWATKSPSEIALWNSAGVESNLTGWRLFVKDFAWAKKLEMSGPLEPDPKYQVEVARLSISSPASAIKIAQLHPNNYYVLRKVTGTKSQYEPVMVTESFAIPVTLAVSWKSDLVSVGVSPLARIWLEVYSHYQGRNITTVLDINFGLSDPWTRAETTLTEVLGVVKGYTAFVECQDVTGDLYFDNVSIVHSGQNWARDPFCYNVRSTYTKSFFQIPRHWVTINVPDGAFYDSFYYNQLLA